MRESIQQTAKLSTLAAIVIAVAIGVLAPSAHAIQASPHFFEVRQPDGTVIKLRLRGDEHYNWMEDAAGFTVVRSVRQEYVYGQRNAEGRIIPSGLRVGRTDPVQAGLTPHLLPAPEILQQSRLQGPAPVDGPAAGPELNDPVVGTRKNLVVLLRFSNHVARPLPSQANFDTLFNSVGGDPALAPTGSVRDYYLENSYGQLTVNSTVLAWVTLPQTEAYYANGQSGLGTRIWQALTYALGVVDATVDFSDFDDNNDGEIDAIAFVHSGYAAEFGGTDAFGTLYTDRIWSHKWTIQPAWNSADGVSVGDYHINPGVWGTSGSAIGRIGVICHETGHFFGLPDLYDTDATPGDGIGSWGLMANSWGFDNNQYYPPHMCSWSKIQLGWVTPTVISTPGTYELQQFETNAEVYRIDPNYPSDEYLLIENRQPYGFEAAIPQGGLCILHIDEQAGYNTQGYPGQTGWPANGNHYRVAVLQADGFYDLERGFNRGDSGDVYHANGAALLSASTIPNTDRYQGGDIIPTNNTLFNISASGSTMTFDYASEEVDILADIHLSDPSLGLVTPVPAPVDREFTIANGAIAGGQNLDFLIQTSVDGSAQDTVGSQTFSQAGTTRYRGNFFQVTSDTSLKNIEAFLNFSGTAQLTFVVYDMPGLASSDVKTLIFGLTGSVASGGAGFYGTGPIDVPLVAGRYYGIAVGWSAESITYIWDQNAQPSVSFGNKVAGFAYTYPLPAAFTGSVGSNLNNYYQRLTVGTSSWMSVDVPLGTVAPEGFQSITVTADATGFAPGTYAGQLSIFSNAQNDSLLEVPVGLLVGLQGQVYLNFGFTGLEFGTMVNPYNTLTEGLQAAESGGTIRILEGGFSPETLDVNQNVTIEAVDADATIGASASPPVISVVTESNATLSTTSSSPYGRLTVQRAAPAGPIPEVTVEVEHAPIKGKSARR